jgi:hypothetical protein
MPQRQFAGFQCDITWRKRVKVPRTGLLSIYQTKNHIGGGYNARYNPIATGYSMILSIAVYYLDTFPIISRYPQHPVSERFL